MLTALGRKLNLEGEHLLGFIQHLDQAGAAIVGTFPLVWRAKPIPKEWHSRTRNEVLTLALTCQRLGYTLPWPALEKIGNWLQVMPMIDDLEQMQINVYYCLPNKLDPLIKCIEIPRVPLDLFNLADIDSWCSYRRGNVILNFVKLTCPRALELSFSCNRVVDPRSLEHSRRVPMRGIINVESYRQVYRAWRNNYAQVGPIAFALGLLIEHACLWRDKFDHYRFTWENQKEFDDLIGEMKSWLDSAD